jgi:hypothetical protein
MRTASLDGTRDEQMAAGIPVGPDGRVDWWYPLLRDGADLLLEPVGGPVELVQGLFCERSKFVIGSSAKSFKTWLSMDLAISIAAGVPFLGRQTRREPVWVPLDGRHSGCVSSQSCFTA